MKEKLLTALIMLTSQHNMSSLSQPTKSDAEEIIDAACISNRLIEVDLSRLGTSSTLVGYFHNTDAPWAQGNCLWMYTQKEPTNALEKIHSLPDGHWRVINMHAENFHAFTKSGKIDRLEVMLLDDRICVVTDPRIPREWLLDKPCGRCYSPQEQNTVPARFPDCFRNGKVTNTE